MAYGPQKLDLGGLEVVDVRAMFPSAAPATRPRDPDLLEGIAFHHDGVIMAAGDQDYSGSTLDEDLRRLQAIFNRGVEKDWGGMPYHLVASPNGRCFYTLSLDLYGAHVGGRNDTLVGVAVMGNFTYAHPGDLQLCAAARATLAIWGWRKELLGGRGHREWTLPVYPTACPGDTWWSWQSRLLVLTAALARVLYG
jgi:hypothetical protein